MCGMTLFSMAVVIHLHGHSVNALCLYGVEIFEKS